LTPPCKVQLLGKGRKWRTCPLWDSTASHLRQQIEERGATANQDDHLFLNRYGRPFSRSGITNIVQRYAARAGKTMPSRMALPEVLTFIGQTT
jgi:site-specific recombinase XerC